MNNRPHLDAVLRSTRQLTTYWAGSKWSGIGAYVTVSCSGLLETRSKPAFGIEYCRSLLSVKLPFSPTEMFELRFRVINVLWVVNNKDEFEKEVAGLFVINYSRDMEPVDCRLHLDPCRMEYLENSGLQLVTMLDLFTMIHGLESQDIDGDIVEAKLRSNVEIIEFESVDDPLQI